MASNRGQDITTNFKVDISNLKKGISEANRQIKLANAEFKAASSGMDDWSKSTEGISAKIEQLTKKLEAEKTKLTAYQKQLELLNQKYEESKQEVDKLTQKHEEAARQYGETSTEAKKYAQQLDKAEAEVERNKIAIDNMTITMTNQQGTVNSVNREIGTYENTLSQLRTAENQAENATDTMNDELNRSDEAARRASDGFTVMKGALSNLLADGIRKAVQGLKDLANAAIEYESAFTGVKKTVNGTEEELAKLDKDIRNMAKSMPQSASDIADVAAAAGQLGIKTNDIADFTKTMIMLGDSTNLSSEEAASELAKFASVVGMSADDYSKLGSVIVALGNNFATTEADVVSMGTRLASAGSQVGMSEANIMSLSAALSAVGLEAESGGTAFSKLLINMQVATEEGGKKLEDFAEVAGMSSKEFKKAFQEDATGALQAFIAGLADSEKSGKSAVGVLTDMGIKETRLRDSILRAVGAKDLFTDAIETGEKAWKEDSALTKEAEQRYKTTASKIQIMKNNFMDVALTLFDKVQPALQKFIEGLTKLANNEKALKKIATTAELLVAAFAVSKISSATKAFSGLLTSILGLAKGTLVINAQTGAIVANTTATTAGTAATRLFNAAWKANPIGLVVTAVALLATGIYALVKATKDSTIAEDENIKKTKELKKEQDELTKSIKESKEARAKNVNEAEVEVATADVLMNKLEALAEKENKSNEEKQTMKRLVAELNEIVPDLNLKYDEEKDALNKSTEAIRENIKAQKELVLAKAAEENLSGIAKDLAAQEIELGKITEQNTKNEEAYLKAKQARADFLKKHSVYEIAGNQELQAQQKTLLIDEKEKKKAYEESTKVLDKSKESLKTLNSEYNKTNEYVSKMYSDAEIHAKMSALTELARTKGKEIPEELAKGMEEGKYAVPETLDGLSKLINFDSAVAKAGLDGVKIPLSISNGLANGEVTVEEAIAQINGVVKFNDAIAKATEDGVTIPKNLSQSMLNGAISVDEANRQLNESIKFDKALQEANQKGLIIPTNLADKLKSGKIGVDEANAQLNEAIKFNESVTKAKEQGIKIPKKLAENIKNGKTTVQDANNIMNNWIKFNEANKKAIDAGIKIPKEISSGIESGKMDVETANAKMNKWIKFNAALEAAKSSGVKIPEELSTNVSNGKTKVETATEALQTAVKKKLDGMKNIGVDAGGNLIEGTKEGINNPAKQSGVFNSIWGFGKNVLKKLKDSLVEKSPSKATNEMGQYLLEGLGLGIEKQENPVLKQVSKFGKSVIDTLNDELSNNVDVLSIKTNLEDNIGKVKSSLSNLNVPSIASPVGVNSGNNTTSNSVVNNFNQVINAPKQPSRIELYRQTKNLLNLKGGA